MADGATLGSVLLRHQLSSGPDGVSYLAELAGVGRPVDVRRLVLARRDPERWGELSSRLSLVRRYAHPTFLQVHRCGLSGDVPQLVTDRLDRTLAEKACDALKARSMGCLVIAPSGKTMRVARVGS